MSTRQGFSLGRHRLSSLRTTREEKQSRIRDILVYELIEDVISSFVTYKLEHSQASLSRRMSWAHD